jgi:DNA repair exonuclease SbcCD ATPase subunit
VRIAMVGFFVFIFTMGCTSYVQNLVSPGPNDATKVAILLSFFDRAKSLHSNELEALYTKEQNAVLYPNNTESMIRLAMLLTIRNTAFRDPRRATRLLQQYLASGPQSTELRQLASLLLHMTADLQQYEAIYREAREKLNENVAERKTQEKKYYIVKNQLKEIQSEKQEQQVHTQKVNTELEKERQEVENLRKKIEQLKTIEKNITERKKDLQPAT